MVLGASRSTRSLPTQAPTFLLKQLGLAASAKLQSFIIALVLHKYREGQPRTADGRFTFDGDPDVTGSTIQLPEISITNQTGDAYIDDTNYELANILANLMRAQKQVDNGPIFGTVFHALFAAAVRTANIPGIRQNGVEQSWAGFREVVRYGLDGSVRTDVVLYKNPDGTGPVVAVWDLKTGGARLRRARAEEIRRALGVGAEVPVFEIHVVRGTTRKSIFAINLLGDHADV